MKLVTYSNAGNTRLGAMLDDKTIVDLNRASGGNLPANMLSFLNAGAEAMAAAKTAIDAARAAGAAGASATGVIFSLDVPGTRLEAPVPQPGKVLAIGLNYRDHAEETNAEIPKRPVVFAKMPTCITSTGAPVHLPKVSSALDWEGELCFVIGKRGRHIAPADAKSFVAGFCNGNDHRFSVDTETGTLYRAHDRPLRMWLCVVQRANAQRIAAGRCMLTFPI